MVMKNVPKSEFLFKLANWSILLTVTLIEAIAIYKPNSKGTIHDDTCKSTFLGEMVWPSSYAA